MRTAITRTVRNIHETLNDLIEEHKEEPEPLALDKTEMKKIFEKSGVDAEKMENFDRNFEENAGEKASLLASNIAETKKFNIETPDVVIKVNPDRADLIETRIIDGRQCLVIPVDDHIEVNGINVRDDQTEGQPGGRRSVRTGRILNKKYRRDGTPACIAAEILSLRYFLMLSHRFIIIPQKAEITSPAALRCRG